MRCLPRVPFFASCATWIASGALLGCAPAAAPCPASPANPSAPVPSASSSSPTAAAPDPAAGADIALLLRPIASPSPLVHVELAFAGSDPAWTVFRLTGAAADHVKNATAHDT